MGKGDTKSRRGKIQIGSFGVKRPRKTTKAYTATATDAKPAKKATK